MLIKTSPVDELTFPVNVGEAKGAFKLSAVVTKAVVASFVVLSAAVCVTPVVPVGSEGVPVKAGLARGAAAANVVWSAALKNPATELVAVAAVRVLVARV